MSREIRETPEPGPARSAEEELEPLITECPSCLTRFRVSLTQLQRARGKVRCGACLAIFNGVEHLTLESAELLPNDDQARQVLDDVLDELAGEGAAGPAGPASAPTLPRNGPRAPIFSGYEDDDDGDGDGDGEGGSELTPEALALPAAADEGDDEPPRSPAVADAEPDVDYSFHVIGDRDVHARQPPASVPAGSAGKPPAAPAAAASPAAAPAKAATAGTRPDASAAARLPEVVDAELVRFGEATERRPLIWVGIAVGVLLLGVQVLWYQFDEWGKDPGWRAVYSPLCAVLGCELPQQRDPSLLSTRNLAVRSHPNEPGTLLVNAIIVNDADFAQPFPVLELRFTTVRGMLVAGRRFQPDEYLAGDAVGMSLVPPKTPVQIELTIDDPGPEAVNYFLRFL